MPKTNKVAKWRKSIKALKRVKVRKTRFTTKILENKLVRIYDNKCKRFIKGDWELGHAMAVLGHLLENPAAAGRFGYVRKTAGK